MASPNKRTLPARSTRSSDGIYKKRKLSSSQADSKKPATSPPQLLAPPPPPPPAPPPEDVKPSLPTSISAARPLPTTDDAQPADLSSSEYQSIAESGVLAEALHRSRQSWSVQGILEKYWTKTTAKNRAQMEKSGNPAKDTMVKLGTCTITIEPHLFDATLYGIRETKLPTTHALPTPPTPAPAATPMTTVPQPQYRPVLQYGTATPIAPLHTSQFGTPLHNTPRISNPRVSTPSSHGLVVHHAPPLPQPVRNTDPVIQMLAEKAATDTELKNLMRTVANGEANPEQLRRFQAQIDELSRLHRARQAQHPQPIYPSSAAPRHSAALTPANSYPTTPSSQSAPLHPKPPSNLSRAVLPARPEFSGVCIEFAHATGDRFLFPAHSILEIQSTSNNSNHSTTSSGPNANNNTTSSSSAATSHSPNSPPNQILASFLIVRKGRDMPDDPAHDPKHRDADHRDADREYYQPVTLRVHATTQKQLEALQRCVKPRDEVVAWMERVMDTCTRAEQRPLALRLPRGKGGSSGGGAERDEASSGGVDGLTKKVLTTTARDRQARARHSIGVNDNEIDDAGLRPDLDDDDDEGGVLWRTAHHNALVEGVGGGGGAAEGGRTEVSATGKENRGGSGPPGPVKGIHHLLLDAEEELERRRYEAFIEGLAVWGDG